MNYFICWVLGLIRICKIMGFYDIKIEVKLSGRIKQNKGVQTCKEWVDKGGLWTCTTCAKIKKIFLIKGKNEKEISRRGKQLKKRKKCMHCIYILQSRIPVLEILHQSNDNKQFIFFRFNQFFSHLAFFPLLQKEGMDTLQLDNHIFFFFNKCQLKIPGHQIR